MKGKLIIASILIIFRKVIFWGIVTLLLSLTVIISLFQTAYFQNWATQKALNIIRENTNLIVSLDQIKIRWFDSVDVTNLEILDYEGHLLIEAKEAHIDYDLLHLISDNQLNFNQLELVGGSLNLVKYKDSLSLNLMEFVFELSKLKTKDTSQVVKKKGRIVMDDILLSDFKFSFDNQWRDSLPTGRFDYGHFSFQIPEATLSGFSLVGDTIGVRIHAFSGIEANSQFNIESFETKLGLSKRELLLDDLKLSTLHSFITDQIHLKYNGFDDFNTFVDSVSISANLIDTQIHPDDLRYFTSVIEEFPPFGFSGIVKGKVKELSVREMTVKVNTKTYLYGKVDLIGLPYLSETFVDFTVAHGYFLSSDLGGLMNDLPANVKNLGAVSLSGRFLGFITDFVAKAELATTEGKIISDINLKFPTGWESAQYSGSLKLTNFRAGAFLGNKELFQKMNFEGTIKGRGMLLTNADFYAEGKLTNTGIYGYNYQWIKAKGHFASQYFDGMLEVRDPNATLKASGNINLKVQPEVINIDAQIAKVDFQAIHISNQPYVIGTDLELNLTGLALDSMNANVYFRSFDLSYGEQSLQMDSAIIFARNTNGNRKIEFLLPEIHGKLEGDYYYSHLINDLTRVGAELQGYFEPEKVKSEEMSADSLVYDSYKLAFELSFGEVSRYTNFLDPELFISEGAFIEGTYSQRKNATVSVYATVDSVNYKGSGFTQNEVEVNISKDLDSLGVLAIAYVSSQNQYWKNMPKSSDLNLEALWQNNNLTLNTTVDQPETNSKASINASLDFQKEKLIFSFSPSNIQVLGDRWYFNPYNKIEYYGDYLNISHLELYQNEQTIVLSGVYSDTTETNLNLTFRSFDMSNFSTISPVPLGGTLEGDFSAHRGGGDEVYHLISEMTILDLSVDENYVGNLRGTTVWEPENARLAVNCQVKRKSFNTLDVSGYVYPERENDQLDIKVDFKKADLELLSPVFEKHVSNLGGNADGSVKISGNLNAPIVNGEGDISEGVFTYDYLGVTYRLEGKVSFNNEAIQFRDVALRDKEYNVAYLEGTIYHDSFSNMRPDIRISTSDFIFLNTNSNHGEIYYGTVHASGNIFITGSFSDLLIAAKIKSEKGTKFYISLKEDNRVDQKQYITFTDFSDTTNAVNVAETILAAVSGVRLDFDMEITPDAYVELIFDPRTSDIIKGTGDGNLKLLLDNNGEFELFGDVRIAKGAYNFTYSIAGTPIISKEFNIRPGGIISFYGDPYAGVLNIDAIYRQLASLGDYQSSVQTNQIPVLVVLSLQGPMLTPKIGFGIMLEDNQASATAQENGLISEINNNERELKLQVFSLLMFRRFSPKEKIAGIESGVSSISEFLTNQISYYISQLNENLEVNVDLATTDQSTQSNRSTLQLNLAYTFLDGRLRVSGGGAFNNNGQNTVNTETNTAFIGDWAVRYLLTADGKLMVRAFSQADQLVGVPQRETGVSLQLVRSFDDLRVLLSKDKKESMRQRILLEVQNDTLSILPILPMLQILP